MVWKSLRREFWTRIWRFYLKAWNSVENICSLYNVLCLYFYLQRPVKFQKKMMKKHNIQLKWTTSNKLTLKTQDHIEFICKHGYHPVTPYRISNSLSGRKSGVSSSGKTLVRCSCKQRHWEFSIINPILFILSSIV